MTGTIFNIQKFCLHDGPGIRTTVFFKGCNLRCRWCANPESQKMVSQITRDSRKCTGCGSCAMVCPNGVRKIADGKLVWDSAACKACGVCLPVCNAGATGKEGRTATVAEIAEEVMKDKAFYDHSGGGVTFSGGEVLLQAEFAEVLADELRKQGVSVAIETAGAVAPEVFRDFLKKTDYVLMDLKHYDSAAHKAGTGVDNRQILENMRFLKNSGIPFLIRIPVIPKYNDRLEDADGFARLLEELGICEVELLPFHQLGQHKYELLDREYSFDGYEQLRTEDLIKFQQRLAQHGIKVKG